MSFSNPMLGGEDLKGPFILRVSRGLVPGHTTQYIVGNNPDLDSGVGYIDVWDYDKVYTYSTTADIDTISSSNTEDTQSVLIEGLCGLYKECSQVVTLNGRNKVTIPIPQIRLRRVRNLGSTNFTGNIYVYPNTDITSGVPDDTSKIRGYIYDGNNITLMSHYTVPAGKTAFILSFHAGAYKQAAGSIDGRFWLRAPGGVFSLIDTFGLHTYSGIIKVVRESMPKISEKFDIKVDAEASALNMGINVSYDLLLIDNKYL
jgi:hypothetical protein